MIRNRAVYKFDISGIRYFFNIIFCVLFFSKGIYAQAPAPVAFITLSSSPLLCEVDAGSVTFNIAQGQAPYNFFYRVDGGPVLSVSTMSTSINVSIGAAIVGTQNSRVIELTGVTDLNYPAVQPITGQTATLTFQPAPTAMITPTGYSLSICPDGGTHTVPSGVSYSNGNILWIADGAGPQGGLINANSTTPTFTSVLADGGRTITLELRVQSDNICASSTASSASDFYTIQVRPAINTTQDLLPGGKFQFCQYDPTAQLKFTASGGTIPYTFTYTKDGNEETVSTALTNTIALAGGLTQEANPNDGVDYTLIRVQDLNCTQNVVQPIITVTTNPFPSAFMEGNPKVCKGDPDPSIQIKIDIGTKAPYTIKYTQDGSESNTVTSATLLSITKATFEPGVSTYSLISVTDSNSCEAKLAGKKASITVRERPNARFSINKNRTSILEPEITITDLSIATDLWYWDFGDSSATVFGSDPGSYVYKDTGTFNIKLIALNEGCGDTTSLPVRIYMPYSMYIPTAFSPNGDGVNDIFMPKGEGFLKYDMSIYDRWGNQVFFTTDIDKGWDGKVGGGDVVPMGICVYVINIIALDKKSYSYSGTVSSIPK